MSPFSLADDANLRPLTEEHHQQLLQLVQRYGVPSLLCALTGSPDSCKPRPRDSTALTQPVRPLTQLAAGASTFSASTLLSSMSAPSLAWTGSEASQCRSDDASINTQCSWPEVAPDMPPPMYEPEPVKISERSWLDSPAPAASPLPPMDVTSHPSPRLMAPTSKKYQCPMCFLDNSPVGFGRKSDFKKHLHNFHASDVVWVCHTKGCHLSFSTERAYSTHAKEAHRLKALPNSAARSELCNQVVFPCGFDACKDRLFVAQAADDASATRDKHFEHIAKHFEDGFDVRHWEYRVQMHNLMRQPLVKHIWKTCIWPKDKRQQLVWRPRSSGDLKRMLECRHLGNDISTLVRLAYILGTAPFSSPGTPPPSEIDAYFQLPYRSFCLIDSPGHSAASFSPKSEDDGASTFTLPKRRSSRSSLTQSVFGGLSSRHGKRSSRPPTPASVMSGGGGGGGGGGDDTIMGDDPTAGPHPGTPFPIPDETVWPTDAPKFAPEVPPGLPKQVNTPIENHPLMYPMHLEHNPHPSWCTMDAFDPYHHPQVGSPHGVYDYTVNTSQASMVRPATPVPHHRPASWGRVVSMESLRPTKKAMPLDSPPYPPETMPTMQGM
ncbi:Uncharacterized protein TCAP_04935 [Tolypocladium capitatum]|uniref:C2H2-type domain-containing protein n=1 Tax=Tolypocladium capitatum TaxID=45235 RepID=A0A2K3QC65_9HYPO|nr:Uncharacterized protein TCAP_04935 [Tolypocladium capitatum]